MHMPQSDVAHSAALTRTEPASLSMLCPSMLLMGPSSLPTDPAHSVIDSSSGASSSMQADTQGVAKVAMFEAPVTHPVDEVMCFFAMAAAYGSRTPRPCWRCMCYCILVAGTACNALSSELA